MFLFPSKILFLQNLLERNKSTEALELLNKPKKKGNPNMPVNAPDTERGFTPAELVRIHEANCQIDFASQDEQNFRIAMMKFIGRRLGLGELKTAQIVGPGKGVQRPKNNNERP